jgi:hypothetical protein
MLKAMMIIAMLGGVDMNAKSEYNSMQECKQSKQVILKQDAEAKVFCVPLGQPTGMANVEALMDRFLDFIRELNELENGDLTLTETENWRQDCRSTSWLREVPFEKCMDKKINPLKQNWSH